MLYLHLIKLNFNRKHTLTATGVERSSFFDNHAGQFFHIFAFSFLLHLFLRTTLKGSWILRYNAFYCFFFFLYYLITSDLRYFQFCLLITCQACPQCILKYVSKWSGNEAAISCEFRIVIYLAFFLPNIC